MDKLAENFTKEYLNKLDMLEFAIGRKLKQGFQGARRSTGKGSSVEFSDFKTYTPGDDIKRIDWNSFARFDKLFIKLFSEEKQAAFNIFIDTSRSMDFGVHNKGYYSKVLAASIAYICLKNTDRINIFSCKDYIVSKKEKISSKARFYEIAEFLDGLEYGGNTDINKAVLESERFNNGAGASFILSDFFSPAGYEDAVNMLKYKGNDVSLIQILSTEEANPVLDGRFRLFDSETNEWMDVLIDKKILNGYKSALSDMQKNIKRFCNKRGLQYIFADTGNNIFDRLYSLLQNPF